MEKIRAAQGKINHFQTNMKFSKSDFVSKDELIRTKERVNQAFQVILKLNEMSIERDAVIVDSLLET